MTTAVQKKLVLDSNQLVTLRLDEFPPGTSLRIVILEEESDADLDTTEYLLSNPAYKQRLLNAIEESHDASKLVEVDPAGL